MWACGEWDGWDRTIHGRVASEFQDFSPPALCGDTSRRGEWHDPKLNSFLQTDRLDVVD
ncbi:MAG: hypothetical protein LR011_10980 [Verrucomicrobia bacterium]|nr:hypothetical protein [Verrucomicrobiota bacterium]